jgi:branched-chain amino acid transport system ATP-binding protein
VTSLLRVEGLRKRFGDLVGVDGVDLALPAGRLTAIIGPNGAGKTTLVNLLTGALAPDAGRIWFRDQEVTGRPTHERVRRGLSRSFQVINLFGRLTVRQNMLVPVLARRGRTRVPLGAWEAETDGLAEADALLREVGLWDARDQPAGLLSHGDQRLLELGIAVAPRPVLCFLDEPASGLTPVERAVVLDLVRKLSAERRTTFAVIEHDMDVVFALAEWILVLHRGRVLAEGPPAAIRDHAEVREIYLGEELG